MADPVTPHLSGPPACAACYADKAPKARFITRPSRATPVATTQRFPDGVAGRVSPDQL